MKDDVLAKVSESIRLDYEKKLKEAKGDLKAVLQWWQIPKKPRKRWRK
jgi:hypothetical protein